MKNKLYASAMVALAVISSVPAMAVTGTPTVDTTGYASIFTDLGTNMTSVATGPVGIGAFAALTVGIVFRVVWKLYKKAGNAVG